MNLYEYGFYKIDDDEFYDYETDDIKFTSDRKPTKDIFDTSTLGGYSAYDEYMDDNKYIIMSTPKEYFEHAAKGFGVPYNTLINKIKNDEEDLEFLRKVIFKAKKKFPMPYISKSNGSKQEGLHRLYVAAELFGWNEKFPVLLLP